MVEADMIMRDIRLDPGSESLTPLYSPSLGYAYTESRTGSDDDYIMLVGFTGQRQKPRGISDSRIASITELDYLQEDEQTIKMQARGVGTRMYNTVEALLGTGEGDDIDAYTFRINFHQIVDRRRASDGTLPGRAAQAARQLGRMAQAKLIGLPATVERIHEANGGKHSDAILYNQSATMELEQRRRGGVEQPSGIPPEFMVIRNPYIMMRKIGTYEG